MTNDKLREEYLQLMIDTVSRHLNGLSVSHLDAEWRSWLIRAQNQWHRQGVPDGQLRDNIMSGKRVRHLISGLEDTGQ